MFTNRRLVVMSMLICCLLMTSSVFAQGSSDAKNRLFLGFDREATLVDRQWWEGALQFVDWDPVESTGLLATVAFQPIEDLEIGGRVGFASTDAPPPFEDGSGATDLDLWAKYWIGNSGSDTFFMVGGILTIPTGDDSSGLGFDAFSVAPFVSIKHVADRVILHGNVGVRFSDDGEILGVPVDGETSPFIGTGATFPFNDNTSFIAELQFEGERFDGLDSDVRALGGVNWAGLGRGILRGAITFGLDDGAPDVAIQGGYAVQF